MISLYSKNMANSIQTIHNISKSGDRSNITIAKKELKNIVKESVREIFEQELMKLRALSLPNVSEEEQKDIEKRYGQPSQKTVKSIEIKI